MFFRTKQIKGSPLLQLVESFRNAEGQPRQRVVASLGNITLPGEDARRIAKAVERQLEGQSDWLDESILKRSVVLYDVTNTHFEGMCRRNPKARHGKNKQKRSDCRQVAVGMAFDEHGLPMAHEVFEGNVADTKTLEALLDRLTISGTGGPALKPVVILDAGFASAANLKMLKDRGWSYLINITRGSRKQYADSFAATDFEVLPGRSEKERVEVKKITDPKDPDSVLVLCRSAQRRLKEEAMISTAEERFLREVKRLELRLEKGQLKNSTIIERKIGALLKKHPRVARFYKITHEGGALKAERHKAKVDEALSLCGDYVLKTDRQLDAAELWQLYMTLLRAEEGFSLLKGSLGLRPNYHQLEDRVEGHIFISVLAYHLLCWIRHHLVESGDSRDWKTVRRLLRTHSLVTTRLPLEDGRLIEVRKPSLPDSEQALVYKRLGVDWRKACPAQKFEMK